MTQIGTVETGAIGELYVFAQLLKLGATVFTPVVDIKGIDAIVKRKDGSLREVQVKTHTTEYMTGWFDVSDLDQHRLDTFAVVFVNMLKFPPEEVWVFPAKVLMEYATVSTRAGGHHQYRLDFNTASRKHGNQLRRDLLEPDYLNAWHILTD